MHLPTVTEGFGNRALRNSFEPTMDEGTGSAEKTASWSVLIIITTIIIITIIIIIWHYNPLCVFAFSAKSLQVLLSLAVSFQFFTFTFFRSFITSSCHRCLGLHTGIVPIHFQSNSFPVGLAWSILRICPSHLIRCALINLNTSAPSINLSISMLLRILHTLSIMTGPNIFLSICLSKMCRLFSSFAGKVQVCDEYVTTGLIIVLYILVFFFRNFDFISFSLA